MFIQRVARVGSRPESWTVIGDDGVPVGSVERYLAFLTDIERSPNTVKAYAHDLKDWFEFLQVRGLGWQAVRLEDVGQFVAWLRLPPAARGGLVSVLPTVDAHCSESTVNRKLSAVGAFYQHCARNGVDVAELLSAWVPAGRRGATWRPFLHHISKSRPKSAPVIRLKATRRIPRVLTDVEVQTVLDACERLRDRLLFAVLHDTGMRVGEALGLRHSDWSIPQRHVTVVARSNDNGARAKSFQPRTVPVNSALLRLCADYLHEEYEDLDSDYVFVNLWGGWRGHPMTYSGLYDLVERLRKRTGVDFSPHWFRHSYATRLLRGGVPVEVVSKLLGHASVTTTAGVYQHLGIEEARAMLVQAGWSTTGGVAL